MLAKSVLLALFGALTVSGFVVPEGTADGLYLTTLDATGNTVLTPLDDKNLTSRDLTSLDIRSEVPASALEIDSAKFVKRQRSGCGTRYNLNHGDCDLAYNRLKATCGGGIVVGRNSAISAVAGSVVTYMCTYSNRDGVCTANDLGVGADEVTKLCGWYVSGYWRKGSTNLVYGRQPSGTCFCHC